MAPSRFQVTQLAAGQNFANNVIGGQPVIWDTIVFDGLGEFDLPGNVFVPRGSGYYHLAAQAYLAPVIGSYQVWLSITTLAGVALALDNSFNDGGLPHILKCAALAYLTPPDQIECRLYQNSGGVTGTFGLVPNTFFEGHLLSRGRPPP